jgi:hypothetical protein
MVSFRHGDVMKRLGHVQLLSQLFDRFPQFVALRDNALREHSPLSVAHAV